MSQTAINMKTATWGVRVGPQKRGPSVLLTLHERLVIPHPSHNLLVPSQPPLDSSQWPSCMVDTSDKFHNIKTKDAPMVYFYFIIKLDINDHFRPGNIIFSCSTTLVILSAILSAMLSAILSITSLISPPISSLILLIILLTVL